MSRNLGRNITDETEMGPSLVSVELIDCRFVHTGKMSNDLLIKVLSKRKTDAVVSLFFNEEEK